MQGQEQLDKDQQINKHIRLYIQEIPFVPQTLSVNMDKTNGRKQVLT